MTEKRENETVTAFTMRKIRNEVIEECAKVCDDRRKIFGGAINAQTFEILTLAELIRELKE